MKKKHTSYTDPSHFTSKVWKFSSVLKDGRYYSNLTLYLWVKPNAELNLPVVHSLILYPLCWLLLHTEWNCQHFCLFLYWWLPTLKKHKQNEENWDMDGWRWHAMFANSRQRVMCLGKLHHWRHGQGQAALLVTWPDCTAGNTAKT